MVFMHPDKCPCTNKWKNRSDKRRILQFNIIQTARSDIKIILGNFNTRVGKGSIYKPTIGNESLHNETNNKGIKMIQFAISNSLNKCKKYNIST